MAGLGELAGLRDQLSQVRDLTPRKILNDAMSGATAGAVAGAGAATTDRPGAELLTGDGSATVAARPTVPVQPTVHAQSATVFDADAT
jgi:hypothetical protein